MADARWAVPADVSADKSPALPRGFLRKGEAPASRLYLRPLRSFVGTRQGAPTGDRPREIRVNAGSRHLERSYDRNSSTLFRPGRHPQAYTSSAPDVRN